MATHSNALAWSIWWTAEPGGLESRGHCVCACGQGGVCVSCSVMPGSLWPLDCDSPGSSVLGVFQVRILWWVATPSSTEGHGRPSLLGQEAPTGLGELLVS